MYRTSNPRPRTSCPKVRSGGRSVGARERRGASQLVLLLCVRIADGARQRIGSAGVQHLPGEEAWLVGEHRSNGERKYYLSNLPADTPIKVLAGAIKARWICEQALQQLNEELGLDYFKGRSWNRLHRHAPMSMMAYAFWQSRRLAQAGRKKSSARLLNPDYPQYAKQSLTACLGLRHRNALNVDLVSPSLPINFCRSSTQNPSSHFG